MKQQIPNSKVFSVDSTLMTMKKQIQHIIQADILVGAHGAGLSWVLAMRPSTSLIELVPDLHFRLELFKNLALVSRHRYTHAKCFSVTDYKIRTPKRFNEAVDNIDARANKLFDNFGPERHKNHKLRCENHQIINAIMRVYKDMCIDVRQ